MTRNTHITEKQARQLNMSGFAIFLHKIKVIRFFYYSDYSLGAVYRFWNPITWIVFTLLLIATPFAVVFIDGFRGLLKMHKTVEFCVLVDKYHRVHPEKLVWVESIIKEPNEISNRQDDKGAGK